MYKRQGEEHPLPKESQENIQEVWPVSVCPPSQPNPKERKELTKAPDFHRNPEILRTESPEGP